MSEVEAEDAMKNGFYYDPDQDPEEKRVVRKKYRSLAKTVEEKQANPSDYTAEELTEQLHRANSLFDKVRGPQEATLDSQFLLMASSMGAQKARAMKSGSGAFDLDEFINKLLLFMGRSHEQHDSDDFDFEEGNQSVKDFEWTKIGRRALGKSRRVPALGFMLGPLFIEQKKRTSAKRSKLEKNKDEQRKPQELGEEDISRSENETTKRVLILERILQESERINIFEFVINPNDYAQSVENIFYLSFLIRDGKVAFEIDEDGIPVIFSCYQPNDSEYSSGLKKRQKVFEFDMAIWKRAIEVFSISESKIPQRSSAQKPSSKWY